MRGPEAGYIHNLDKNKETYVTGLNFEAENLVRNLFQKNFPNMETRPATKKEDSGYVGQGVGSKMIDIVISEKTPEGTIPSMAMQVTINNERHVIEKKMKQMNELPFVRLDEMKQEQVSVPRILVFLKPDQVKEFAENPDDKLSDTLTKKIIDDTIKSLHFDLTKTKYPKQQEHVQKLLDQMLRAKTFLESKEKGRPLS